jgi:hypothetical protein
VQERESFRGSGVQLTTLQQSENGIKTHLTGSPSGLELIRHQWNNLPGDVGLNKVVYDK